MAPGEIHILSSRDVRPDRRAGGFGRRLFAIAYFDMVGYSRLIGLDDTGTVQRIHTLRHDLIDPGLERHGGRLVQTAGDSLLVVFDSAVNAVRCAVEVQQGIPRQNENFPRDRWMLFRVGVEIGDIIMDGDELHGDGVNVAARLQDVCPPGGVCISRAVHDQIRNRLDVSFDELGPLPLKNISRPVEALVARLGAELPEKAAPAAEPEPRYRPRPKPAGGPPWIAVLPFQRFDDCPTPGHISDGLVADIVCQLAGLRELRVISHGSTLGLCDTGMEPHQIGELLGARYLVRGLIRREGARTRLTAELIVAGTGEVIWARTADLDDPLSFDVQDRLVGQIVNRLAPSVRNTELRRIRGSRPEQLRSYEKILLARENIRSLENDRFLTAKSLLDEVIADEPDYAEAFALAADWHGLMVGQDWSRDKAADVAAVDRLARKALALDDGNVRALACYGHRRSLLHRDYVRAKDMFTRALDAAPSAAQTWLKSSYTFAYIGEIEEAVTRAERATELSPRDEESHLFYSALCVAHYTAGNYDTAAQWGMRALAGKTMLRSTAGWAAASLVASGRIDEAQEVAVRTTAQWPERRVRDVVARHPYQDAERRGRYGEHLLAAGFPY